MDDLDGDDLVGEDVAGGMDLAAAAATDALEVAVAGLLLAVAGHGKVHPRELMGCCCGCCFLEHRFFRKLGRKLRYSRWECPCELLLIGRSSR